MGRVLDNPGHPSDSAAGDVNSTRNWECMCGVDHIVVVTADGRYDPLLLLYKQKRASWQSVVFFLPFSSSELLLFFESHLLTSRTIVGRQIFQGA